ncbi:sensor histidine kinase KdpD [Pseudoflavonifractor sp. MSJ-37]|uniref:sensor histidine kinase n=1 Tax=Pseudoflavonifractor sp. MSJ-37 TaxID=2841531 RepID=UPI001C1194BF|nr:HAMP domain-containing sensor histidine kinase [Pseudoflavonifractor sp. MSJ-37]MBU5434470.1 HAMP domain-containing histidine kinase [Pseudoflavonifractor sp. MSJ-37]
MWILLAILLGVLCVLLLLWRAGEQRSLRSAIRQLRALEESGSSVRLRLEVPNAAVEELLAEIDRLLELRRSDRAESRAREQAIRRQISNVSHDLRTPLTSILGYLQLLEQEDLPPERRREYLSVVEGRAKALQALIGSFYELSRLEGGELRLERQRVDLRGVLSELLAAFYDDFTEAGFEMEVDLPEDLPPVAADPGGALRICTNLLRNALDHGAGPMSIRLTQEGDRVVSVFANAAPGLEPEDVPRVFERFYTSDKMRTGQNTGLGLAIVKALSEQMGCAVSASGDHARFEIRVVWPVW